MPARRWLELSDLIVSFEPGTLRRLPVRRAQVVETLLERGQSWGARLAASMPVDQRGVLIEEQVDRLLCHAHAEIQLLSEETLQGERVWRAIAPIIEALRGRGVSPIHVVDVGCGLGYVTRYLAAHHGHDEVRYLGVDFNRALVRAARAIAERDRLAGRASFFADDAFTMQRAAHIYTSTGVVHHFDEDALEAFFAAQFARPELEASLHFDIQPSWLSPIGAWMFHQSRFKVALGRHDGYYSARRAHTVQALASAAIRANRRTGQRFEIASLDGARGHMPWFRIMQALVAARPEAMNATRARLGPRRLRPAEGCEALP